MDPGPNGPWPKLGPPRHGLARSLPSLALAQHGFGAADAIIQKLQNALGNNVILTGNSGDIIDFAFGIS